MIVGLLNLVEMGGAGEEDDEIRVVKQLQNELESMTLTIAGLRESVSIAFSSGQEDQDASNKAKRLALERLRLEVEHAELEALREEEAEKRDLFVLQSTQDLRTNIENCHLLDERINQNNKERIKVEEDSLRLQFLLEARQLKLLSELQTIYPIERIGGSERDKEKDKIRYAIRGIEFQSPFEGNQSRDDEQISTVLGYIVHTTLLVSKYLEIPLRYQLLFFASRSMIRDPVQKDPKEQNLPLYRKDVEPERFRRAFHWLTRDIEQLLAARGIAYTKTKDILFNLSQLFKNSMDPGGTS